MKVVLRKLAQANRQTGLIGSAVIESKLIPGKTQYSTGLAEGLTAQEGNGLYYLAIGKKTSTKDFVEGAIIDVLVENGNFTTELGAEIESVKDRRANEISGTLNFEFTLQEKVLRSAMSAGILTVEQFNAKMEGLFDKCQAKAEAKVEAKIEARRVANPVQSRRDRRNNVDLSAFGVTTSTPEGLTASAPETPVTEPVTPVTEPVTTEKEN